MKCFEWCFVFERLTFFSSQSFPFSPPLSPLFSSLLLSPPLFSSLLLSPPLSPLSPPLLAVFFTTLQFTTCAYAHPIQYGEDLRLACARGENERVEELLRRGCNPMATDGMGWTS